MSRKTAVHFNYDKIAIFKNKCQVSTASTVESTSNTQVHSVASSTVGVKSIFTIKLNTTHNSCLSSSSRDSVRRLLKRWCRHPSHFWCRLPSRHYDNLWAHLHRRPQDCSLFNLTSVKSHHLRNVRANGLPLRDHQVVRIAILKEMTLILGPVDPKIVVATTEITIIN